jgi:hypothetical protein
MSVWAIGTDFRAHSSRWKKLQRAGKQFSDDWRTLIGPWGWMITVYANIEAEGRVVAMAFHHVQTTSTRCRRTSSSLGQQMGQHAPRISADPSRSRFRENRLKLCPT